MTGRSARTVSRASATMGTMTAEAPPGNSVAPDTPAAVCGRRRREGCGLTDRCFEQTTLKAEIIRDLGTLRSDVSRPFDKPSSGRIAVKVINHLGDEAMKVFRA